MFLKIMHETNINGSFHTNSPRIQNFSHLVMDVLEKDLLALNSWDLAKSYSLTPNTFLVMNFCHSKRNIFLPKEDSSFVCVHFLAIKPTAL